MNAIKIKQSNNQTIKQFNARSTPLLNSINYSLLKLFTVGLCLFAFSIPSQASDACKNRNNNTHQKLQECITKEGLVQHLKAFQEHADANTDLPGTRFTGTLGYQLSEEYIVEKMTAAGYQVTLQDVPLKIAYVVPPYIMEMIFPNTKIYLSLVDFAPMTNGGRGDVTASVQIPNNLGCNAGDFAGFTVGNIALIQRGTCNFRVKTVNAVTAGASAVIIYNNVPGLLQGTLGSPPPAVNTPVIGTTTAVGTELRNFITAGTPPQVHIKMDAVIKDVISHNILAESPGGNPDNVVMVGAHLDSVDVNSGMNDNGSSAATILETALLMQKVKPVNKLRFAWWTAEELNLVGSTYYVTHLSSEEKNKIALYLNHEILGAPNGGRFIMGTTPNLTSPGSEVITKLYSDYFNSIGLKSLVFDPLFQNALTRSDMFPFIQAGIPIGYTVTGANFPFTQEYANVFTDLPNRVIGLNTHPCYHQLCETLTLDDNLLDDPNFDFDLYLQMSKAAAFAILTYSMNTESVNGVSGKGNFKPINNLKLLENHEHDVAE